MLELVEVSKVYKKTGLQGGQLALHRLSCRIGVGKVTALLGHNGAGKTTALRLALGLIKPDSGRVLFEGQALSAVTKAQLGYMPETSKLPQRLTALEVLALHSHLYPQLAGSSRQRRQRIDAELQKVGLWEHRRKLVGRLSKGMGRRLAWVLATMHQPRLLILDEPFSGLDPEGRDEMGQWVLGLKKQGATVIFSSHDLSVIPTLCEHVLILRGGRLLKSIELSTAVVWSLSIGRSQAMVESRGRQAGLPPPAAWQACAWQAPAKLREDQEACCLVFTDYEEASRWLRLCSGEGLPVFSFQGSHSLSADDLRTELAGEGRL